MNHFSVAPGEKFIRGIFLILVAITLSFGSLYWLEYFLRIDWKGYAPLFDLDGEGNLFSWYASALWLLNTIISASIAWRAKENNQKPLYRFWLFISAGFLLCSVDETAQLHERYTTLCGQPYYKWLPYFLLGNWIIIVVIFLGIYLIWRKLRAHLKELMNASIQAFRLMLSGILVNFAGESGLEVIGHKFFWDFPTLYRVEVTLEEVMGSLGTCLILRGLLHYDCLKACSYNAEKFSS